jgi:hypothetical protein
MSNFTAANFTTARRMTARFDGTCALCGNDMPAGTDIRWNGDIRRAAHETCCNPGTPGVSTFTPKFEVRPSDEIRFVERQSRMIDGVWHLHREVVLAEGTTEHLTSAGSLALINRINLRREQGFDLMPDANKAADELGKMTGTDGHGNRSEIVLILVKRPDGGTDPDALALAEWAEAAAAVAADPFLVGGCHPGCNGDHPDVSAFTDPKPTSTAAGAVRNGGLDPDTRNRIADAVLAGSARQMRKRGRTAVGVYSAQIDNHNPDFDKDPDADRSLAELSGMVEPETHPAGDAADPLAHIHEGRYTIIFPDEAYRTIRVSRNDNPDFFNGEGFTLGYLSGPDNDTAYTGFGIIRADGLLTIWRKFRGGDTETKLRRAVDVLLADPATAGESYALASRRCYRCNRTLTVPASLHRGLGPDCAEKVGMG